jgi:hypothetical protein
MASVGWNKDISKLVREFTVFTQEDAFDAFEKAASDVATAIMQGTPLGVSGAEGGTKGTLRNNWQIGREANKSVLKTANPNKGRTYADSKILGRLRGKKSNNGLYTGQKSLYLFNNSPYVNVVEYGGYPKIVKRGTWLKKSKRYEKRSSKGFSKQSPHGMFRLGKQRFNKFFKLRYKVT